MVYDIGTTADQHQPTNTMTTTSTFDCAVIALIIAASLHLIAACAVNL